MALGELVKLVETGQITGAIGKKVFATMFETGAARRTSLRRKAWVKRLTPVLWNPPPVKSSRKIRTTSTKYKSGNEGVFKFFVGQVMRATQVDKRTRRRCKRDGAKSFTE